MSEADTTTDVQEDGTPPSSSGSAPFTRGPLTVEYCPNCTMPPEYCEFSSCFAEKCRAWLEKHHPELLTDGDVTAKVATLSVEEKKDTEEKKDSKADKKAATAADNKHKHKAKPAAKHTHDDDDEDDNDDDDDDDDDDEDAKPKGSAAAAIRTKGVLATGVYIRKEQRSKHKYITSVKGMDAFGCDLKKAAKSFSKKFACSASVVKVNEGGQEIQIQGDVSLELPDFIVAEFKEVNKSQLFFMDKANKKTKCF